MTIVTKVGVSYIDHMNDDTLEVDSFSHGCYQALSFPHFSRREPPCIASIDLQEDWLLPRARMREGVK